MKKFNLIMISAMYENGGNTIQRHLDGHSELFSYPFESQVGTKKICDYLSTFVPNKYRWSEFQLGENLDEMYEDIWDEEVKIRVKAPHMSKFKDVNIDLVDKERKEIFKKILGKGDISRASIVEAFFKSTNMAWKNYKKSGKERIYVGYNPVQILDADKIVSDFPSSKVLHIVRNPFSAYAETKHRPAPLTLERYINTWNITQLTAINFQKLYPDNIIIVKFEDLVANPRKFFTGLCRKLDISFEDVLLYPSWNGERLDNIYPWGTVQYPTVEYNTDKAKELSKSEHKKIEALCAHFNDYFNYKEF